MRLTERILSFTLLGSEWVLWLLIGLSVLSVAVMVERAFFLSASGRFDFEALGKELLSFPAGTATSPARAARSADARGPESQVAVAGLEQDGRGAEAISEAMASTKSRVRLDLERNLGVLGTLGNNAPFIGLFGTVLGIIKAFADLSHNQGGRRGDRHVGHLGGARRDGRRPHGRDPGRHRLQLLPGQGAPHARPRRRDGAPDPVGASGAATGAGGAGPAATHRGRRVDAWPAAATRSAATTSPERMIVDINVTPLVDITLVLLIIFMVTASYIVSPSIKVDLPKAASGSDQAKTHAGADAAKDGALYLNGERSNDAHRAQVHRRHAAQATPICRRSSPPTRSSRTATSSTSSISSSAPACIDSRINVDPGNQPASKSDVGRRRFAGMTDGDWWSTAPSRRTKESASPPAVAIGRPRRGRAPALLVVDPARARAPGRRSSRWR